MSVPIINRAVEFTGEMAERRGVLDKVEVMLERANMPLRAPEAMFFAAVLALILVVLSFFADRQRAGRARRRAGRCGRRRRRC